MSNSTEPTNQLAAALLRLDEMRSRGDLSSEQFRALVGGLLDGSAPELPTDEPDGVDDNDEVPHSGSRLVEDGAHSNPRGRLTAALAVLAACALLIAILGLVEAKNARSELRESQVELEVLSGTLDRRSDQLQDISSELLAVTMDIGTLETDTERLPRISFTLIDLQSCVAAYQGAIADWIEGGQQELSYFPC